MKNWLIFVVSFCLVVICKGQVTWHQLGYEYYIYTGVGVNYQAAVSACTSMSATLARIKTKQVQDFLMEKLKLLNPGVIRAVFYIGLKRIDSSSTGFQWNDGTMVTSGYTNWRSGEPNNAGGNENCVELVYATISSLWHGKWNDVPCSANGRYICERRVVTWHQLGTNEYYIGTGYANYQAAVSACTSMNATLARIKTKQVQDFVLEKIKLFNQASGYYYIGLTRIDASSTGFQWNDGTVVTSGYTNWRSGEPNNWGGNENCVVLYYTFIYKDRDKWNDAPCSWTERYICERRVEKDTTTQQQTPRDTQRASTTTTNNDPLEQMRAKCEFSTIHVVLYLLGSIVGTSVVFIIGIWIYCKTRRKNGVIAPPPPQQELHLEPILPDHGDGYDPVFTNPSDDGYLQPLPRRTSEASHSTERAYESIDDSENPELP
uniref:macrophage mannose receptor 1-like n=1 Tax=Ciona intestinalis TaxID=7719 RepID=UPI00089DCE3E|nr:macrophage mannose receptor 1-like [Ciona intestinalis]|eukprot:XP_026695775.1 macrophage mannose receptor 1-like [Ciona intestinalis]